MANWDLLSSEEASLIWDENLANFADCSPFQSYAFGQCYQDLGWQPCYWGATNKSGKVTAMCLGLLRRYPLGLGIVWCIGGPVGDVQAWDESLRKTILETTGLKRLYMSFRCDRERNVEDALYLNHRGWSRSISPMTSGFSMELDLACGENALLANFDRRWRRNLRLAEQNDFKITLCANPDIEELSQVFAGMEARKKLPQLFAPAKLESLFKNVKSNLIFYRCEDAAGNLMSFRSCLAAGNRATDYFAATTERGREFRASYAVLWRLLRHCGEQGVRYYDLGGIDPWANPGVYTFKKETGARKVESLGEWDWATSSALRFLGNWGIAQRHNLKVVKFNSIGGANFHGQPSNVFNFLIKRRHAAQHSKG